MQLHADEPERLGFAQHLDSIGLAWQHSAEAQHARLTLRQLANELIERAAHARLVCVVQRDHARHTAVEQEAHGLWRAQLVANRPRVCLEPTPERIEHRVRKHMHVPIDDGGQPFGDPCSQEIVAAAARETRDSRQRRC